MKTAVTIQKSALAFLAIATINACGTNTSPKLQSGPEETTRLTQKVSLHHEVNIPKVDILFVIDDSMSMLEHQQRLAQNISQFVDVFAQQYGTNGTNSASALDYHIGVISTSDSETEQKLNVVKDPDTGAIIESPIKFYDSGKLRPLLVPGVTPALPEVKPYDMALPSLSGMKNFITPATHFKVGSSTVGVKDILKESLVITMTTKMQNEESFLPVINALSSASVAEHNAGFYRPEAHLAVVFITDTDDQSPDVTPADLDSFLRDLKKDPQGNKINYYGVLSIEDQKGHSCGRANDEVYPTKIMELMKNNEGRSRAISLCEKDFGVKLGSLAEHLRARVSSQKVKLTAYPEANSFQIYYVGHPQIKVPATYDPSTNEVTIEYNPKAPANAEVAIEYEVVKLENLKNGRTKPIGK